MTAHTEIVVVGGGYAGVMAANRLTQRDDVAVTLINPRPAFVDRIRLHQFVGGTHDPVVEYRRVLSPRVRLVVDSVTRIDAAGRAVTLASGGTRGYDYLIYAVGSGSADAAGSARPIGSLEEARRLRQVLDTAPATAAVTVVGAGPTGIETAAELAERGRAVTLVCGDVLGPYLHPRARRSVATRLARLGVSVLAGPGATATAVTDDAVHLRDGRQVPSGVTVWAAGFGVPDLAARSGLSTDGVGRLLTDETLTSVDDERIVAAGDSAAPSGLPFRMSCQAAVQLGPQAAETVLRRVAGERPAPIRVAFVSQCISLGRRAGILQVAGRDDVAKRYYVAGRAGARVKELICRSIIWQLGHEARRPGSLTMRMSDPRRRRLLAARVG